MASKTHLVIDQGTTFSTTLNMTDDNGDPLDLHGFSASSQMRKWYTSSNSINFSTSINTTEGTITLFLSSADTNYIVPGRYVYDVELTDLTGAVSRIVEGIITVTPQVTR